MRLFGKRSHFNFDEIFHQYKGTVYKIIRRTVFSHDDAMDISQNVFINIYKYLPNFKGDSDISTWIYRITVNETSRFFTQKYDRDERRRRQKEKDALSSIQMPVFQRNVD